MLNSFLDVVLNRQKVPARMVFKDGSFKEHAVFCFLILKEIRVFPLDIARYIIQMVLKDGIFLTKYQTDFDKNGILYFLGTDHNTAKYMHPQERNMVECTPVKIYSGNILQSFCHDTTYLFKGTHDNIVQNWHYTDEGSLLDLFRKDLCMYIRFLRHSVLPIKYTIRHGYPGGHALRSWNLEATNDKIEDAITNKTWVILDERNEDLSISPTHLSNSATFDIQYPDSKCYNTFRIKLTGPNSSQSHYLMMAGFEMYGTLFPY